MERLAYERIYCDTNAIIYAVESFSIAARDLLIAASKGEVSLFTSHITLHETLVAPLRKQQEKLIERYQSALNDNEGLELLDVDEEVLIAASALRAMHKKLDMPDALHIASATLADCSFMLSEDRALDDFLPEDMERLTLEELKEEMAA